MMTWRIYYDDGTTYEGDPYEAPALGVVCILDYHGDGWHIDERSDYYVWQFREDGWTGTDLFGLWDYLTQPGPRKVLFGRTISNTDFGNIHILAYLDMQRAAQPEPELPALGINVSDGIAIGEHIGW